MLSESDWVLILTTLFLGSVAIVAPYLSDLVKRRFLAPKLRLNFDLVPPMSRITSRFIPQEPELRELFFDFHFQVINEGKTKARQVEAILQKVWVYDVSDRPKELEGFFPVNLRYDRSGSRFVDINPLRPIYWNLGNVPSQSFQNRIDPKAIVDIPGKEPGQLRFFFDLMDRPFFQPNCLLPGKYGIELALYSENAKPLVKFFEIGWSGNWRETEDEMFRECVISEVKAIKGE